MSQAQNGRGRQYELTNVTDNHFGWDYKYDNVGKKQSFFQNQDDRFRLKDRKITSNRPDLDLPDNQIQTNKYSCLNFIPKNLYQQFSKRANLYFLLVGIMQTIKWISISDGVPVIFLPLVVIVTISALQDFYEDYKRIKSDREENTRPVEVLDSQTGKFEKVTWESVRVGNIVKIYENEYFPADILLLQSSEAKGVSYIETKNLDGETNLKIKTVQIDLVKLYQNQTDLIKNNVIFNYEKPSHYLYVFSGFVVVENGSKISVNYSNLILRGCCLRNTKFVCGQVAYSGHDSKIMLNLYKPKGQRSSIETLMGQQIFYIFLGQIIFCLFTSIYYLIWYENNKDKLDYLHIDPNGTTDRDPIYNFFVRYGNWMLIFTNFVPISLLVTLEMVQFIQGMIMGADTDMGETHVQTSNLNEQLGQIQYLFSDQTGTLTCNIMEFKKLTIGDLAFGDEPPTSNKYIKDEQLSQYPEVQNVDFRDLKLFDIVNNPQDPNHKDVIDTLFCLAVCHTVVAAKSNDKVVFNATSPDQIALVNFAKFAGFDFEGIDEEEYILVKHKNQRHQFKLLHVFEFDSNRKRMSVVVQTQSGDITIYCKGADNIIKDRSESSNKYSQKMDDNLLQYGQIGLRTLLLAEKTIQNEEYMLWLNNFQQANTDISDRDTKLKEVQDELETNFRILGVTAIEDQLQNHVPETIDALQKAGIQIWVLTGDKVETAINIGFACQLLTNVMNRFEVEDEDEEGVTKGLKSALESIQNQRSTSQDGNFRENALIITGDALLHMSQPTISALIIQVARMCQSVICCRVSPKQKQQIVSLVRKEEPKCPTLAIGDGANDVNMITAAHVGIGIRGVEGQQAARAADYSIFEFQNLRRLLFYHGRECYRRNSYLVCYNFFQNILLVLPQFWYGINNRFSGQSLYDSYLYQLFNLMYTSMPITVFAIFDEEYTSKILVENKENYYEQGLKNLLFNPQNFWNWSFFGLWQAVIIVYCSIYSIQSNFPYPDGYELHFWCTGTMVFGLVVVVANLQIFIISNDHSFGSMFFLLGSMIIYLCSWAVVDSIETNDIYGILKPLFQTGYFHLGNLLAIVSTSFIDYFFEIKNKWTYQMERQQESIRVLELRAADELRKEELEQKVIENEQELMRVRKQPIGGSMGQNRVNRNAGGMIQDAKAQLNLGFSFTQVDPFEDNKQQVLDKQSRDGDHNQLMS